MGAPGFEYLHAVVIVAAITRLYMLISALSFTVFFSFFICILVVPKRYLFGDSLVGCNAVDLALKWDYYGFE